jgi:hypothetical protein
MAIGYRSLFSNTSGSRNVAIGVDALYSNQTTSYSVAIGYQAANLSDVDGIVAIGYQAALVNRTGVRLTAIGYQALLTNDSTLDSTAVGYQALQNTIADFNTGVGVFALQDNTTGSENVAVGDYSVRQNTTGNQNTGVGSSALSGNLTGTKNTALGAYAMIQASEVSMNTMIGVNAGGLIVSSDNIGIGVDALGVGNAGAGQHIAIGNNALAAVSHPTANGNVSIGHDVMKNVTRAGLNVVIGYQAMQTPTVISTGNVVIGANAEAPNNTSHSIVLGRAAASTASNQFVVGSTSYNAGAVTTEVNSSSKAWNVIINGVAQKILLA